jgi:hypothetical protein
VEGRFVEEDVLYRRTFCMGGRFVEGRFVDGRLVEGRLVGRTFCSEGRFVEGRFVLVRKESLTTIKFICTDRLNLVSNSGKFFGPYL